MSGVSPLRVKMTRLGSFCREGLSTTTGMPHDEILMLVEATCRCSKAASIRMSSNLGHTLCPGLLRWVKQLDVARAWSYFAKKGMSASHYRQLQTKDTVDEGEKKSGQHQ